MIGNFLSTIKLDLALIKLKIMRFIYKGLCQINEELLESIYLFCKYIIAQNKQLLFKSKILIVTSKIR